jgi:hypothetical protein
MRVVEAVRRPIMRAGANPDHGLPAAGAARCGQGQPAPSRPEAPRGRRIDFPTRGHKHDH